VGFSVQWTGQLVSAFSESYTLNLGAAGVAKLYLRPSGTTNYTLVVDNEHPQFQSNTGGGPYQEEMSTEANWTARYVGHEGGWALGGDRGGTAIENSAKFNSPNMGPCVAASSINCTEGTQKQDDSNV